MCRCKFAQWKCATQARQIKTKLFKLCTHKPHKRCVFVELDTGSVRMSLIFQLETFYCFLARSTQTGFVHSVSTANVNKEFIPAGE